MHEAATGWLLSAGEYRVFLGIWLAAVGVYGIWRSIGKVEQDPLRESGPVF